MPSYRENPWGRFMVVASVCSLVRVNVLYVRQQPRNQRTSPVYCTIFSWELVAGALLVLLIGCFWHPTLALVSVALFQYKWARVGTVDVPVEQTWQDPPGSLGCADWWCSATTCLDVLYECLCRWGASDPCALCLEASLFGQYLLS